MTGTTKINSNDLSPELFLAAGNRLGEGATYDSSSNRLYWVDILGSQYYWIDASRQEVVSVPFQPGFVALLESGEVLAGGDQQLMLQAGDTTQLALVPDCDPRAVVNDGVVTPDGQCLVFGTRDEKEEMPVGRMISITATDVIVHPGRFTVFNGPAFSPCGSIIYFTDSAAGNIWKASFDSSTGAMDNQTLFASVPPEKGYPDGMCTDDEGCLWSAHWDGSCLTRYHSDGSVDAVLQMPVSRPTSVAFGGHNRSTLYITSAMPDDQTLRTDSSAIVDGDLLSMELPITGATSARLLFNPIETLKNGKITRID